MPITVLVSDKSDAMRRAIHGLLAVRPEITVVGECADITETIQMANDLNPQVVVMDLYMLGASSLVAHKHLHLGSARLVATSLSNDDETKHLAEDVGASVLLDKMYLYNELVPAIIHLAEPNAWAVGT